MYASGKCENLGDFSIDNNSGMVDNYILNALVLSEGQWKSILTAAGATISEQIPPSLSAKLIQRTRHALYILSSPIGSADESQ